MSAITINEDLCHKDGICAAVCPAKFIVGEAGHLPKQRPNGFCIQCGQCVAFCPHKAITVEGLDSALALPVEKSALPTPTGVDILLKSRRSIRQYTQKPVEKALLDELLHTAAYGPTGKNSRLLRHVVVYEPASLKALGDCIATCMENDPLPLIAEGKNLAAAWRKGNDMLFRGAPHVVMTLAPTNWPWNVADAAICLTYLEIAAHAHGVGACWAGYITAAANHFPAVRAQLGVKDDELVAGGQMLGYPRLKPGRFAPRTPYPATWL